MLIESGDVMKKILKMEEICGMGTQFNILKDIIKSVVRETKEKAGK